MKGCLLFALSQAAQAQAPCLVVVGNATAGVLECQVLAAHWYSWPVMTVAPGGSVTVPLLVRGDGTVLDVKSGLPVERMFCGPAGRAWEGRADIDLRRLAAKAVVCREGEGGLVCD